MPDHAVAQAPRTGTVLSAADWSQRAEAHRHRAEPLLSPQRRRTAAGQAHPVWDFLFTYYSVRPGQLLCWHPGYGVVLAGDLARRRYLHRSGYVDHPDGVTVGPDQLNKRSETIGFIAGLLAATAARPAQLNCFGLHEWAVVYRRREIRHSAVPLRLGPAGTDAVLESLPLRCSHFDAFRFFTEDAVSRNAETLTRPSQMEREQPGCVHANMDLFKWCLKLSPLVDSDLLLDCLELAAEARELDMRASPYDLTGYGFAAIEVEQPAGRAEYARRQSVIAHRAAALRQALLDRCHMLMPDSAADPGAAPPTSPPASLPVCRTGTGGPVRSTDRQPTTGIREEI